MVFHSTLHNMDIAPYKCLRCGNRVGLSFVEKKHDCTKPYFTKDGSITDEYRKIWGERK